MDDTPLDLVWVGYASCGCPTMWMVPKADPLEGEVPSSTVVFLLLPRTEATDGAFDGRDGHRVHHHPQTALHPALVVFVPNELGGQRVIAPDDAGARCGFS
jgi:hypothetical protein